MRAFGDEAPPARLKGLGGEERALPSDGLLVFAKAGCPTCRWALPFFQRMHELGVPTFGIFQDPADAEAALVAELGLTFPVAVEESPWPVSAAWGLTTVPSFFLLREGRVRLASEGFARDDLREAAAVAGAPDPFGPGEEIPAFRPG